MHTARDHLPNLIMLTCLNSRPAEIPCLGCKQIADRHGRPHQTRMIFDKEYIYPHPDILPRLSNPQGIA